MIIIEPHIHMYSRTTDDYQAMYHAGIRACVEPSFWLGSNRRHAGTFFDYFRLILDFETIRARRFGIDHFCAISLNPKETEDAALADEVVAGLDPYLSHPRCVAIGEIGFNLITVNEERVFTAQIHLAHERNMPAIIHLPHQDKVRGIRRTADIIRNEGIEPERVLIDHNTEATIALSRDTGCFTGMTVYPISKLTPERVSAMIRQYGSERIMVNGSADWGISDPLSLPKVVAYMRQDGHSDETIRRIVFHNAMTFYRHSPRWIPKLDMTPEDPRSYQR